MFFSFSFLSILSRYSVYNHFQAQYREISRNILVEQKNIPVDSRNILVEQKNIPVD